MNEDVTRTEFLGIITDSNSAIKFSGSGGGGRISFDFDQSQVVPALYLTAMSSKLLKITVEVVD